MEIDRLRKVLRLCMPGPHRVDLGDGTDILLHLNPDNRAFADIKASINKGDGPTTNA